jgi:uncharacterized protein (DUF2164 family)
LIDFFIIHVTMTAIQFTPKEREVLVRKLQSYFSSELHQEIERFDAEFLLDFFARELGSYFYNRALNDAQTLITDRIEDLRDALYQLEQHTEL